MWPFKKKEQKKEGDIIIPACVYDCPKSNKCPKWVVLTDTITLENKEVKVVETGRCADAWNTYLYVEIIRELKEIKELMKAKG